MKKGGIILYNDKFNDELPKYRKRKVKSTKKSDHKHIYSKEVLFKNDNYLSSRFYYGTLCEICGKVGQEKIFETERIDGRKTYRLLNQGEIIEKYKGLPIADRADYN